jgi:hypothetical protein
MIPHSANSNGSLNRRRAKRASSASSFLTTAEIEDAEKACRINSSVIALTLRVDTPCMYISVNAATNAFSARW